jgi:alpha-D-xyloside xylohydrolase
MRALFLEFPQDLNTYSVDTQYMFGSNLMVAPVFSEEGEVTFYVPRVEDESQGAWVSWFDYSKTYEGGRWYTETHGFDTLPILVRPGTVTITNPLLKAPEDAALEGIQLLVNGRLDGETSVEIVNPGQTGEVLKTIQISPAADGKSVEVEGEELEVIYLHK